MYIIICNTLFITYLNIYYLLFHCLVFKYLICFLLFVLYHLFSIEYNLLPIMVVYDVSTYRQKELLVQEGDCM